MTSDSRSDGAWLLEEMLARWKLGNGLFADISDAADPDVLGQARLEFVVLAALKLEEVGALRASKPWHVLARELGIKNPRTLGEAAGRLQDKGLIRREPATNLFVERPHHHDARITWLTPEGNRLLGELLNRAEGLLAKDTTRRRKHTRPKSQGGPAASSASDASLSDDGS